MDRLTITTINTCRTDNVAGVHQLLTSDIYLIQETILPELALNQRFPGFKVWKSKGEGTLGIATIIKDNIPAEGNTIIPGRLHSINIDNLKIVNIYSPAGTNMNNERREFFSRYLLAELQHHQTIVAGDFNSVIDPVDVEENYRNKVNRMAKPHPNIQSNRRIQRKTS